MIDKSDITNIFKLDISYAEVSAAIINVPKVSKVASIEELRLEMVFYGGRIIHKAKQDGSVPILIFNFIVFLHHQFKLCTLNYSYFNYQSYKINCFTYYCSNEYNFTR